MQNISLNVELLSSILSPIDLIDIISPSSTSTLPFCLNSDNTPVSLKTTFLSKSPSSKPKYVMFDLILAVGSIGSSIPVQFKNWLTVLSV